MPSAVQYSEKISLQVYYRPESAPGKGAFLQSDILTLPISENVL